MPAIEREYLEWYHGKTAQRFNPQPLVQAAKEQWADRPELIHALAKCTQQWPQNDEGFFTLLYDRAEEHGNGIKWRHAGSLWLECEVHGELLIDVHTLINNPNHWEIRSIEFMDKVIGRSHEPVLRLVHSKLRNNKA